MTQPPTEEERLRFQENLNSFRVPAIKVDRISLTPAKNGYRIAFGEEQPDRSTLFCAAVFLAPDDAKALRDLLFIAVPSEGSA